MLTPSADPPPVKAASSRTTSTVSWRLLALLMAVTGIGSLSLNVIVPAVPGLAATFKTTPAHAQLTITLFMVGMAVAQLILGPLSDRIGRRPVLIAGLALAAAAAGAAIFATSLDAMIVARIAQAVGGATGVVVGRAIIRDLADRDRTAGLIGLVTTVMVVSPMVAPILGGVLDTSFGWSSIFIFQCVFAGILFVWALLVLPETLSPVAKEGGGFSKFATDLKALSRSIPFWCYALCGPLTSAAFYVHLGGTPHAVVTMLGRSSAEFGFWAILPAVGYMIGNGLCARLSPRYGIDRVIRWGIIVVTGATVLLCAAVAFAPAAPLWQVAAFFLPHLLVAFGNGLVVPNSIAGAVSIRPECAGTAAGIVGFLQMGIGAMIAQHASVVISTADSIMPLAWLSLLYTLLAIVPVALLFWLRRAAKEQVVRLD